MSTGETTPTTGATDERTTRQKVSQGIRNADSERYRRSRRNIGIYTAETDAVMEQLGGDGVVCVPARAVPDAELRDMIGVICDSVEEAAEFLSQHEQTGYPRIHVDAVRAWLDASTSLSEQPTAPAEGTALALEPVRIPAHAAYVPRVAIDAEAAAWTPPAETYLTPEDAECLRRLMEWRRSRDHGLRDPRFKAANEALTPGIMMRIGELLEKAREGKRS